MQPQPSATAGGLFFGLFIGKPPYNCKQSLPSLCHSVRPSAGQNVESEQTPVLTFSTVRNAADSVPKNAFSSRQLNEMEISRALHRHTIPLWEPN